MTSRCAVIKPILIEHMMMKRPPVLQKHICIGHLQTVKNIMFSDKSTFRLVSEGVQVSQEASRVINM